MNLSLNEKKFNMKKILLFQFILCLTLTLHAQDYMPFLSGSPVWKVYIVDNDQPSGQFSASDIEYRLLGDTVIEGMDYRVLSIEQTSETILYPYISEAYLRENIESQQVFIRFREEDQVLFEGNEEVLLYDFSLSAGDSYTLYQDFDGNEVNLTTDTTYTIGGEEMDAWVTDFPISNAPSILRVYVEGIGYLSDPLMPIFVEDYTSKVSFLYCYQNIDLGLAQNFEYLSVPNEFVCSSSLNTQSVQPEKTVEIYPNPTGDVANIIYRDLELLTLTNLAGQVLDEHKNIKSDQFRLDVSRFNEGLYLLRTCDANGQCNFKRLVINK
jgi:hypothetical protein